MFPNIPYGCLNLKEICKKNDLGIIPKTILVVHALPETNEEENNDEQMTWFRDADIVFSVGPKVERKVSTYISSLDDQIKPVHKMYIPSYPLDLFGIQRKPQANVPRNNIVIMTEETEALKVDGLDFSLAISSVAKASVGKKANVRFLTAQEKDEELWEKKFREIPNCDRISFQCFVASAAPELKSHMEKAHLFLECLKPDSTLFGVGTLGAIAAGVPVLVSENCGVVSLLKFPEDSKMKNTCDEWSAGITRKLREEKETDMNANEKLRKQLLLDTNITKSQLDSCLEICGRFSTIYPVVKHKNFAL